MTLYHANEFLAHLDSYRICSITGFRGSGKDLLAFELSRYWLDRGYMFYSNQRAVWNDSLTRLAVGDEQAHIVTQDQRGEMISWVYEVSHRVYVLSEGGRYLRKWAYFENMFEFARKMDVYILIPSVRIGHEDLAQLLVYPVIPFRTYLGTDGGVWYWTVDTGLNKKYGGWFIHIPKDIGVYDTDDLSENTNVVINAFAQEVERRNKKYGRDELLKVDGFEEAPDEEYQASIARKIQQAALSLLSKKR